MTMRPSYIRSTQIKAVHVQMKQGTLIALQDHQTTLPPPFLFVGVFPACKVAMNRPGFEGQFHPHHTRGRNDSRKAQVIPLMAQAELI